MAMLNNQRVIVHTCFHDYEKKTNSYVFVGFLMFSSRSIMPFWLFKNAVDSLKWLCKKGSMMVDHDRPLDLWMLFFHLVPYIDCKELYHSEDEQLDDVGCKSPSH